MEHDMQIRERPSLLPSYDKISPELVRSHEKAKGVAEHYATNHRHHPVPNHHVKAAAQGVEIYIKQYMSQPVALTAPALMDALTSLLEMMYLCGYADGIQVLPPSRGKNEHEGH